MRFLDWTMVMCLTFGSCVSQDLVYFPGLVKGLYGYSYGGYSPYYDSYAPNSVGIGSTSGGYRGVSRPVAGGYRGGALPLSGGYRGAAAVPVPGGYRGLASVGGVNRHANSDYYDNVYALAAQRRQNHDYY